MNIKKINLLVALLCIVIGTCFGYFATFFCGKCLVINSRKDAFYGKLAIELEKEMKHIGYNFNCPNFLPKAIIDFTYTNSNIYYQNRRNKRAIDTNIVLVADCFEGLDIEFLKEYDFMLTISERDFGYLAMFNFKGVHFPLKDRPFKKFCDTQYEKDSVDIKGIASQLDDIIQREKR